MHNRPARPEQGPLGLTVRDLAPRRRLRKVLPDTIQGVVVVDVDPGRPGASGAHQDRAVVLEVNRGATSNRPRASRRHCGAGARGDVVAALVYDPITNQRALVAIVPDRDDMTARILVIDDEPAIRDTMRMTLEYERLRMPDGRRPAPRGWPSPSGSRPIWCSSTSRCRAWTDWRP